MITVATRNSRPPSAHFVVYATRCESCHQIAAEVERVSAGLLRPVSYDEAVNLFKRADLPRGEPSIVSVQGTHIIVRRGAAMARFAVRHLGVVRSVRLKQLLDNRQNYSSRRAFLRTAAGGALVLAGIGSAVPAAAKEGAEMVAGADLERLVRQASNTPAFREQLNGAGARGYDISSPVNVAARWPSGETILITCLASLEEPENEAELIFLRVAPKGTSTQVARRATRRSDATVSSPSLESDRVETQSVQGFIGCVLANAGGQCGSSVTYCANLRFWQLIIACLAGRCGPVVVRAAWKCRSAL